MTGTPCRRCNGSGTEPVPAGDIFAAAVFAGRQAAGLTQKQLADRMTETGARMHPNTISKIESGDRPVSLSEAVQFARLFGSSLDGLVTR